MIKIRPLSVARRRSHPRLDFRRSLSRIEGIIFPAVMVLSLTFMLTACGGSSGSSRFEEIRSQPPYSPLTDSIRHLPKNADLYFRRAVLLNRNNLPEPALADFQRAWSLRKNEM